MAGLIQRAVLAVVGFVLWFGYVTVCDGGLDFEVQELASLPPVVFEGGGGTLEIDLEVSQGATLMSSWERWDDDAGAMIESEQELAAGTHHFSIDVPNGTYGYLELAIEEPEKGAEISWILSVDGEELSSESQVMGGREQDEWAFFVNFEFEEIGDLTQVAKL